MAATFNSAYASQGSIITRFQSKKYIGVETIVLEQSIIGYIHSGTKTVHTNGTMRTIASGSIYHFPAGIYHLENIPSDGENPLFEEVVFSFSPQQIAHLFDAGSIAELCRDTQPSSSGARQSIHICRAWPVLCSFFDTLQHYIDSGAHKRANNVSHLKLCELVYLMISHVNAPFLVPLVSSLNPDAVTLHSVVYGSILSDSSLGDMAERCNMSLGKFKQYFEKQFGISPHRWLVNKRLEYAKFYLVSTNKSVNDIAKECMFGNTSYFIKRFKETYNQTPIKFRQENKIA